MSAKSAFSGNDSPLGTNINAANGSDRHTVKGIGVVQRAAMKRITGAAAVGAVVDAADESKWPNLEGSGGSQSRFVGSKGSAKKRSLKPGNKHVVPTPKGTF